LLSKLFHQSQNQNQNPNGGLGPRGPPPVLGSEKPVRTLPVTSPGEPRPATCVAPARRNRRHGSRTQHPPIRCRFIPLVLLSPSSGRAARLVLASCVTRASHVHFAHLRGLHFRQIASVYGHWVCKDNGGGWCDGTRAVADGRARMRTWAGGSDAGGSFHRSLPARPTFRECRAGRRARAG